MHGRLWQAHVLTHMSKDPMAPHRTAEQMTRKHKKPHENERVCKCSTANNVNNHRCASFCDFVAFPSAAYRVTHFVQSTDICLDLMLIKKKSIKTKACHNCDTDNEMGENVTLLL